MGLGINLAINLYSTRSIFRDLEAHPKCKIIQLFYICRRQEYIFIYVALGKTFGPAKTPRPSSLSYCFMWLNLYPAISFSNNIDKHACSAPIKFDSGITHLLVKKI